MTLFISVIIPILDSPTVGDTIHALEHQTYDPSQFEVIVVGIDNHNLVKVSKLVRFDRSEKKLSPAQARNRGARQARGNILAFLDSDCIPNPNWVEVIAKLFSNPNIHVIGGGVTFEEKNYWTLADNISMFYEYYYKNPPGVRLILPSLNFAIRKEVFDEVGGFDERYKIPSGEDADFTIRLRNKGYLLIFEPYAIVNHQPYRNNIIVLLRHSYFQGKYSTKVDHRYYNNGGLPWPFRTRLGVILFAPFIGFAVTIRIFIKYRSLLKYWHTMPIIYLSKLAWCVGAANHPNWHE